MSEKNVLIGQPHMELFGGSSNKTFELARTFQEMGATVYVYAYTIGEPLVTMCKEAGIYLFNDLEEQPVSFDELDVIWVHSQVMPRYIIEEFGKPHDKIPSVIFFHMSPFDFIPDERPYCWQLEDSLSDFSLFNSLETRGVVEKYLEESTPKRLFCNPAPVEFCEIPQKKLRGLNDKPKVLIVSNHPPVEVVESIPVLEEKGCVVELLGGDKTNQKFVDATLLSRYDIVVSIGATVQYCLVAGIPCFIYDKFGGPGYLTNENIDTASNFNYSGRGFTKMTPEELAVAIIDGYQNAFEFQVTRREEFIEHYSMRLEVERVLQDISTNRNHLLPTKMVMATICSQQLVRSHFFEMVEIRNRGEIIASLNEQLDHLIREKENIMRQRDEYAK